MTNHRYNLDVSSEFWQEMNAVAVKEDATIRQIIVKALKLYFRIRRADKIILIEDSKKVELELL